MSGEIYRECELCGNYFTKQNLTGFQKYCSPECKKEAYNRAQRQRVKRRREKKKLPNVSLLQKEQEAREAGLTYGKLGMEETIREQRAQMERDREEWKRKWEKIETKSHT